MPRRVDAIWLANLVQHAALCSLPDSRVSKPRSSGGSGRSDDVRWARGHRLCDFAGRKGYILVILTNRRARRYLVPIAIAVQGRRTAVSVVWRRAWLRPEIPAATADFRQPSRAGRARRAGGVTERSGVVLYHAALPLPGAGL